MSSVGATSTAPTVASCIAQAAAAYVQKVTGSSTGGSGGGGGGGGGGVQGVDPANDSPAHEAREAHSETVDEAGGGDAKAIRKLAAAQAPQAVESRSARSPGVGRLIDEQA